MGGTGSGSWYRWNTKTTTDQVKRIDIRYLKKLGVLNKCCTGSLSWSCGNKPRGNISFTCYPDSIELNLRFRKNDDDWQLTKQTITFDRTSCHYGGDRLWFLCPRCSNRVGVLYGADILFLCRHCYQLPYASQQDGYRNNAISQKHKLGERIFEHYEYGDGWGKKKGMHWSTFNRLHDKYKRFEQQWYSTIAAHYPEFIDFDI